jgi:hypothetical protein
MRSFDIFDRAQGARSQFLVIKETINYLSIAINVGFDNRTFVSSEKPNMSYETNINPKLGDERMETALNIGIIIGGIAPRIGLILSKLRDMEAFNSDLFSSRNLGI